MTLANRIALASLLVFFPSVSIAQSRSALALSVGPTLPLGRLRDTQLAGEGGSIGFIRGSDDSPIGLRLDFSYDRLNGRKIGSTPASQRRFLAGTANILFSMSGHSLKPYIMGGIGFFKITSTPTVSDSRGRFGFDFGLGATIPFWSRTFFIEGRVNSISQNNAKPVRYVPIRVGILF